MDDYGQETLEEIRVKRSAYQALLESAGWKELAKDLLVMHGQMVRGLLNPLDSADLVYAQEYLKGEAQSLARVLQYPKARFDELVEQEQSLLANLENDE